MCSRSAARQQVLSSAAVSGLMDLRWRRSDVVDESQSVSVPWLQACVFLCMKRKAVNKIFTDLHWSTNFNHPLEFKAGIKDFVPMPSCFPRKILRM